MDASQTPLPRWRRRPAERPTEILEAALDVFAEQGLARARVEDIAARAGVSKGTIYLYFTGKEELFREAVRHRVQRTLAGLTTATGPGRAADRLERFIDAYWAHLRQPAFPRLYRLLMAELHQFPELTRFYGEEVSGKVIELTAEIIEAGRRGGELRDVDSVVAARMIVGLLVQHALWASQRELFPHLDGRADATLVEDTKAFIMAGLVDPGAADRRRGR